MVELLTGVIAALFGFLFPLVQDFVKLIVRRQPAAFSSGTGQVILKIFGVKSVEESEASGLLSSLSKTSAEMDRIVSEIGRLTKERQSKITQIENQLASLSQREQELKAQIKGLEKTPLPVADYFAKLVERTEKRSAVRDYGLFLGGVVLTSVVAVILKKLGWG